jgi:hypothetical protein
MTTSMQDQDHISYYEVQRSGHFKLEIIEKAFHVISSEYLGLCMV